MRKMICKIFGHQRYEILHDFVCPVIDGDMNMMLMASMGVGKECPRCQHRKVIKDAAWASVIPFGIKEDMLKWIRREPIAAPIQTLDELNYPQAKSSFEPPSETRIEPPKNGIQLVVDNAKTKTVS